MAKCAESPTDDSPEQSVSARVALGLHPTRPLVLVMGGSQGATGVNDLFLRALPQLLRGHYQLEFVLVEPFVRRFIQFPAAVELAVDGSGTTWAKLFEDATSPLGYQILSGTVAIEPAT